MICIHVFNTKIGVQTFYNLNKLLNIDILKFFGKHLLVKHIKKILTFFITKFTGQKVKQLKTIV